MIDTIATGSPADSEAEVFDDMGTESPDTPIDVATDAQNGTNTPQEDPPSTATGTADTDDEGIEPLSEIPETPEQADGCVSEDGASTGEVPHEGATVAEESHEDGEADSEGELERLRTEIGELRRELEERREAAERMEREIGEFSRLFPTADLNGLPDTVCNDVRAGVPLAAAYALYEKRREAQQIAAQKQNELNRELSTGPVGKRPDDSFFTPDEVRAMSRGEVRANYSKILESMKKWN